MQPPAHSLRDIIRSKAQHFDRGIQRGTNAVGPMGRQCIHRRTFQRRGDYMNRAIWKQKEIATDAYAGKPVSNDTKVGNHQLTAGDFVFAVMGHEN